MPSNFCVCSQAVFIALYSIIIVVGITGNVLVIVTIVRCPSLQTRSNMFIFNMATADILICLLAAPLTPLTAFTGSWHLGPTLCQLVPTIQVTMP